MTRCPRPDAARYSEEARVPNDLTVTPTEMHWLTIADAARLIESRRLSPLELTDALLARIDALDPQLNAFLLPTPGKGARPGQSGGARDHGRPVPRAAARHTIRAEGHLRDRRHPHHEPLQNLRKPRPDRRCDHRREALPGRRGIAWQARDP